MKEDLFEYYYNSHKVLMWVDFSRKLCIEIEESGGYLLEKGEIFLAIKRGERTRRIFGMDNILKYTKEHVCNTAHFKTERFFMEKIL